MAPSIKQETSLSKITHSKISICSKCQVVIILGRGFMIKLSVMIHSSQEEISIIPTKIKISEEATITGVVVEEAVAVEDT